MVIKVDRLIPMLLYLCFALSNQPVWSGIAVTPKIYLASIHGAEWTFDGSTANCELRHEIPGFGIGRFQRLAGEDLQFRIDSFQRVPVAMDARLHEVSPPWIHDEPDPLIRKVELRPGMTPMRLSRKSAAWLLASLSKGQIVSFDFFDWDDERKPVSVQLSPVNYQRSYEAFRRCLQQISDKDFMVYREIQLQYPSNADSLDASARRQLDALMDFVLADSSISRIKISGHTDARGSLSYNRKLSQRRAQGVYDYLAQGGVHPELMQIEVFGQSRPKRRGRNERAMAANRRVEVKLIR